MHVTLDPGTLHTSAETCVAFDTLACDRHTASRWMTVSFQKWLPGGWENVGCGGQNEAHSVVHDVLQREEVAMALAAHDGQEEQGQVRRPIHLAACAGRWLATVISWRAHRSGRGYSQSAKVMLTPNGTSSIHLKGVFFDRWSSSVDITAS